MMPPTISQMIQFMMIPRVWIQWPWCLQAAHLTQHLG